MPDHDSTAAKLAGANVTILAGALERAGVDPELAALHAQKHAGAVPYLADGQLHADGVTALAARVADAIPAKFKTTPATPADAYDPVAAGLALAAEQKAREQARADAFR